MDREGLLGRGIYDPTEAARLARVQPQLLARFTTGKRPLVEPAFGSMFDFEDLVSLLVVAELYRRRVPIDEIRIGIETLAQELGVRRPLAHIEAPHRLATVGRSFFAHLEQWVDAGKGFQLAFPSVVEPVLKALEYDTHGLARLWRPVDQVTLVPLVQAGTPCVEDTRVPTSTIAGLIDAGEDAEDVAWDLDLELAQITAALGFEEALRKGQLVGAARGQ